MDETREQTDLLLQLKGLVLVRGLLEARGASPAEVQQHSDEIERVREQLALLVRTEGGGAQRAAA